MTLTEDRIEERDTADSRTPVRAGYFSPRQLWTSLPAAIGKLDPRHLARNPVMFVVLIGSVITTVLAVIHPSVFAWLVAAWLWFTLVFANLAESVAEGRGKAQAASLRAVKRDTVARRRTSDGTIEEVPGTELRVGDEVVVSAGEIIPGDGDVVEGIASVDESAITGESAPVVRESGGDRSAVTGGTGVLSDQIVVRITAAQGETFVDRMISLVEGASRQKTPNEVALNILLASLTIIFLLAVVAVGPMGAYARPGAGSDQAYRVARVPDSDDHRRAAVGDRYRGYGPPGAAQRTRDVRARCRGGRGHRHPADGQDRNDHLRQPPRDRAASRARSDGRRTRRGSTSVALADGTPEGRSIVDLCGRDFALPLQAIGCGELGRVRRVHRADTDERNRSRRRIADSQGCSRLGARVGPQERRSRHHTGGGRHDRQHRSAGWHTVGGRHRSRRHGPCPRRHRSCPTS